MKYTYVINSCETKINEQSFVRYGISCIDAGSIVKELLDISDNKNKVLDLVNKCNELNLDPQTLKDLAEEYI